MKSRLQQTPIINSIGIFTPTLLSHQKSFTIKSMKTLLHILVLILSFGLIFTWEQTGLSDYTVQGLGVLIICYILITAIRRKRNPQANWGGSADIFILNTAIFLLIDITNTISSPLFFLLYFLGFGITFIFEPVTVFVFAIGTIVIFLPEVLKNGSLESYIKLGSLLLISPLAFFFGQEYKARDEEQAEIEALEERSKDAADTIAENVEEVLENEKATLKPKDVEKMNEILEEAEDLREEK